MTNANEQYGVFAAYYDRLIDGTDYDEWYRFLTDTLARKGIRKGAQVLDLACGTGAFALRFAKDGYDTVGVDLSEDMLSVAQKNSSGLTDPPLWIRQDMRFLDLNDCVDAAVCCLDGMNYLSSCADLTETFRRIRLFLKPRGVLIFDINTEYKFRNILKDNVFVYEKDGIFCTWENIPSGNNRFWDFRLTFFRETGNGSYTREEEWQREYVFGDSKILKALRAAGFSDISVCSDFNGTTAGEEDERHFFICQ